MPRVGLSLLLLASACGSRPPPDAVQRTSQALSLSPEIELDLPRGEPSLWDAVAPQLAFDGTEFVAVWLDTREGTYGWYGAHLNPITGALREPTGVLLSPAGDDAYQAALSCTPTQCLLLGYGSQIGLRAWRLDASFQNLGVSPIPAALGTVSNAGLSSRLATDGIDYAVAAFDAGVGLVFRVGADGGVSELTQPPISPQQQDPIVSLDYDGAEYVLVWNGYFDGGMAQLEAARFLSDGTPIDLSGIAGPLTITAGFASTSGQGAVMASWNPGGSSFDWVTFGSGTWSGASSVPPISSSAVGLAFDGTAFWGTWIPASGTAPGGDFEAAQLLSDGGLAAQQTFALFSTAGATAWGTSQPVIACGAGSCVVASSHTVDPGPIFTLTTAQTVSSATTPPPPVSIPTPPDGGSWESAPAAACGTHMCLTAWIDDGVGGPSARAARVTLDGGSLDPTSLLLASTATQPRGVWVGAAPDQFLVIVLRSDVNGYVAQRMDETGALLDTNGFFLPGVSGTPSIAFEAPSYVIATYGGDGGLYPVVRTLPTDGGLSAPIAACPSCAQGIYGVHVASSGSGIALVTSQFVVAGGEPSTTATRIDSSGNVLDPAGITVTDAGIFNVLAGGPHGFLLVGSTLSGTLATFQVDLDGGVSGPTPLPPEFTNDVAAVADHAGYVVASTVGTGFGLAQMAGIRLWPDGGAIGPAFQVLTTPPNALGPSLAASEDGIFLAYQRYDPSEFDLRARARFIQEGPDGTACTVAPQCASGFCVNGVCSATPFPPDAGAADAGAPDAGVTSPPGPTVLHVGCGAGPGADEAAWAIALLSLAFARRRDRGVTS